MLEAVAVVRRFAGRDFVRHSAIVFAATMLVNVCGYAFHFAISRRIGVVAYGVLSALNAGFMLSLTVSTIVGTVVVKYVAELRAVGDGDKLAAFVRRTLGFCFVAGLVATIAGLVFARAIGAFLKVEDTRAVDLVVAIVGMTVAGAPLRSVFQGTEEFATFALLALIENVLKAALGIAFVYAGFGVTGAFGGWAIGSFLSLVATATVLLWRFRTARGTPLRIDFRRLGLTMANVSISTLALTVIGYFDVIVVKHYADPTTAGLYGALALSGKILLFFVGFVPTIVLPKASRMAHGGRSPFPIFAQAMGLVLAISAGGLLVYGFAPGAIVTTLAGPSFAPAAPYVLSYGIAMVLLAALSVVVSYKTGLHHFDFIVPVSVVAVGEVVAISLHHRTLTDVIAVLIVGNGLALVASLYRVNASFGTVRAARVSADAA